MRAQFRQGALRGREIAQKLQRGQNAVACSGKVREQHVSGLFPAQVEAVAHHFSQHVAVPHIGGHDVDAGFFHRAQQAQIAHRGRDERVVAQITLRLKGDGQNPQDLVAVHNFAVLVNRETPIGVPIEGDARIRLVLHDGRLERAEVGGSHAVIDVQAIRLSGQQNDFGARRAQGCGADGAGRAVRAVDDNFQAIEAVGRGGYQVIKIGADHVRFGRDATHIGAHRAMPGLADLFSISSSTSSVSLWPLESKNLIPLSGIGLCEAETMTPKSTSIVAVRCATAGVGTTPRSKTSTPVEAIPAAMAAEMNSPDARGSRARRAIGRGSRLPSVSTSDAATASARENSAVMTLFASPRTPSVPKSLVMCRFPSSSPGPGTRTAGASLGGGATV